MYFQITILNTSNVHTVIWYQVFLSNIHNFLSYPFNQWLVTTTPDQSGPWSNANERFTPQTSPPNAV